MANAAVARLCRDMLVKLMAVFGGCVTHTSAANAEQMTVQLDRQIESVRPGDLDVIYLAVLREQGEISVHRSATDVLIARVHTLIYLLGGRMITPRAHGIEHKLPLFCIFSPISAVEDQ